MLGDEHDLPDVVGVVGHLPIERLDDAHRLAADRHFEEHVVFGRVVEGMDVVKKMEAQGSQSGSTKSRIVIADCGQL